VIEGGVTLPEGSIVVIATTDVGSAKGEPDALYHLDELAVKTGIPDLAMNIDHYLYGHPKVSDAGK